MWLKKTIRCVVVCLCTQEHLKKIEKEFGGRNGVKLVKMAPKNFATACKELFDGMRPTLNKSSGPGLLKEYSPWLHSFHTSSSDHYSDTIEVPGECCVTLAERPRS